MSASVSGEYILPGICNRQVVFSESHSTAQLTSGNLLICHNMIIYIHVNIPLDPTAVLTSVS